MKYTEFVIVAGAAGTILLSILCSLAIPIVLVWAIIKLVLWLTGGAE